MTTGKYFIYIAIVAVLLIACYYRESIEDSIDSLDQNIKNIRKASPFTDDQIDGVIQHAMGR